MYRKYCFLKIACKKKIKLVTTLFTCLFFALPVLADGECKTYSECTAIVLKAQSEARASLARLGGIEDKIINLEAQFSKLEARLREESVATKAAIKAAVPKMINRGIIKTVSVTARRTAKTDKTNLYVSASEGFCALTRVGGRFDGTPENINVFVQGGNWYYQFGHGAAYIYGTIVCVAFSQLSFE